MEHQIKNIIEIIELGGTELSEVRNVLLNESNHVDFNKIIPMPKCLIDFEPRSEIIDACKKELYFQFIRLFPQFISKEKLNRAMALDKVLNLSENETELIVRASKNYNECEYIYWYDWCNDNWGTSLNAYGHTDKGKECQEDDSEFHFITDQTHPYRIIHELSRLLPNVTFSIKFAGVPLGSEIGLYHIKGGKSYNMKIANCTPSTTKEEQREWREFSFRVWLGDVDPREYGLDENWECSDGVNELTEEEVAVQ